MHRSAPHDSEETIPVGSHKGLIAFCETNLRYEKGFKAWVMLGPYLLGALFLEGIINATGDTYPAKFALWTGFLAYLILFPGVWRRFLKWRNSVKTLAKLEGSAEAR